MPPDATEYDPALLASAPEATKAQLQSGYAVDLLDEPSRPLRSDDPHAAGAYDPASARLAAEGYSSPIKAPPLPFYRTRRGITVIIIAFVAIVAIVVGVGVGVSARTRDVSTNSSAMSPHQTTLSGNDSSSTTSSFTSDSNPATPSSTSSGNVGPTPPPTGGPPGSPSPSTTLGGGATGPAVTVPTLLPSSPVIDIGGIGH